MPRVKGGPQTRRRRKKILKAAKGYRGIQHNKYKAAMEAVWKAGRHAYRGRKQKKREFRSLWIQRINAAARLHGMPYNQFIHGLQQSGTKIDRKMLADIAMNEPAVFEELVKVAKAHL